MIFLVAGCVIHHTNIGYATSLTDDAADSVVAAHHLEVLGVSGPAIQTKFSTQVNQVSLGWGLNTAALYPDMCAVCSLLAPRIGVNFIDYSYEDGAIYWGAGSPYAMLLAPTPLCIQLQTKVCLGAFAELEYLVRFSEADRMYGSFGISIETLRMPSKR